ncbi:MAG: NFACT family protein [Clostridiales Family XIII bacterium]|jgi:predicted ribosome quality control (RQC) complex YloA/Tae2 family protein|nr:NFACT family protein [Clostridiales Family XIII bacterium]
MPFDNFVVGAVAREMDSLLTGARVDRVYQPEREEIILCLNTPPKGGAAGGRYNLLISANSGRPLIYLAERREAGPQNPPGFCMLLRKHLLGARVLSVSQPGRERIVNIAFLTSGELGLHEERTLVFELMGKHSNIILTEPREHSAARIVDAIKRISFDRSRVRQILPGMDYLPPPAGKGISPIMEEETAGRPGNSFSSYEGLADAGTYAPCIYYEPDGNPADFHVFHLHVYESLRVRDFASVSEMLETWYETRENAVRISGKSSDLTAVLKARLDKLCLKKQRLSEEILDAGKADEHRHLGNLITANIWRLEKGAARTELEDYTEEGQKRLIELDPRLTPAQNAQRYYKRYSKAKTAAVVKAQQLAETQEGIDYLESVSMYLDAAKIPVEIDELRAELIEMGYLRARKAPPRKPGRAGGPKGAGGRKAPISPISITLPSGAKILVGRNNRENDELTLRQAAPTDIWLHTKDIPGSHVILKMANTRSESARAPKPDTAGENVNPAAEADLRAAAAIAAWYSNGRQSEGVPVDYTLVKYVKKPSGAKPGYVIFTHTRTLYAAPALP